MTLVAATSQGGGQFGRAFRQNDIAFDYDSVATEMHCLLRYDVDQIGNMFANGVLTVFVERRGKPSGRAVRQGAKTSVEMIKARINKFHRDNEAAEHLCDRAMRFDVGPEFVAAKKCVAGEKRVAFAFEIEIVG